MKRLVTILITNVEFNVDASVDGDKIIYNDPGNYKVNVWMDEYELFDKEEVKRELEDLIYDNITFDINNAEYDVYYDVEVTDFTWMY